MRPLPQENDPPIEERRTITATPRITTSTVTTQPLQLFSRSRREQMRRQAASQQQLSADPPVRVENPPVVSIGSTVSTVLLFMLSLLHM